MSLVIAGNPDRPILYHVQRTRDGDSFSSRQVEAVQAGEPILTMLVSYHKLEPEPFVHQYTMPATPSPLSLSSYDDLIRNAIKYDVITRKLLKQSRNS